jgi:DNA-binding SARP family transcriptional activator
VVGAGVVRLLDRLRRVQQRHRSEGSYIRLPDPVRRMFEQRLRVGHGLTVAYEADLALRQIGASVTTSPASGQFGLIKGIRIHDEVIELIVTDSVVSDRIDPTPSSGDGHRVMMVDRRTLVPPSHPPGMMQLSEAPPAGGPRSAAPLMVTVGHGPSGLVMVNLESLGSLVVTGNPTDADAVVRALALELAMSYWAGQFSMAVVGFGSELERFEGVTSYPDVSTLIHLLCQRRILGASQLRSAGFPSFAHARQGKDPDRWAPMVVICGPEVVEDAVTELLEVGADPVHGTAVVAVGERVEAQYSVRLTGGDWSTSLELLGAAVFPQRIRPEELHDVTSLLDTAANRQSVLSSEEPYVSLPIRLPGLVSQNLSPVSPVEEAPPHGTEHGSENRNSSPGAASVPVGSSVEESTVDVEVSVLGPIEIRGAARAFTRAWAEELVVYLAMHPNGVSNEAWATALWPDRLMASSSLHSTASVARRSLGQSAEGLDHLPRSHGRLALSSTVGTDWDRFVGLADSDRPEQWRAALALVRGRPFEGLRSSDWPILEGIAPAMESAVVDLSGRLAGASLRQGDTQGAEWAARRGLVVSPYDERLYRMLMRAADLGGNPAGVDAVMSELLTLVAEGIEPLDAVHPSTMDLYRQLSRRRRFSAGR